MGSIMKFRKITSLTALLSFIFLLLTSIILFIVPHGRVAYWSDWRLWGLNKTQWADLHTNGGVLFLLAIFLHTYLNWKPIVNYLKNKSRNLVVLTKEFNLAMALLLVFCIGTYFQVAPFSWILSWGESFKDAATEKYGEPPYGHAELSSLKMFTQRMRIDLAEGMSNLRNAGMKFDNEKQTILAIAALNNITPKEVYNAMKPANGDDNSSPTLPQNPKPGLGKRLLKDLCAEYNLDETSVLEILKAEQIDAKMDMKIKTIAEQNQMSSVDVYMIIKNATLKK